MAVTYNKLLSYVGDYIGEQLHGYKGNSKGYLRIEGEYPQNNKVGKGGLLPTLESNFIGEGDVAGCLMVVKYTECCGQGWPTVSRWAGNNTLGCRWTEVRGRCTEEVELMLWKWGLHNRMSTAGGPWQGSILAQAKGFYVWTCCWDKNHRIDTSPHK